MFDFINQLFNEVKVLIYTYYAGKKQRNFIIQFQHASTANACENVFIDANKGKPKKAIIRFYHSFTDSKNVYTTLEIPYTFAR